MGPGCKEHDSTYSSTTSHSPQQTAVDLDNFLHGLAGDPIARRSSGIRCHNDPSLKSESKSSGAMSNFNGAIWVAMVVGNGSKEGGRLDIWIKELSKADLQNMKS